jgi:hypothetical protein
MQSATIRVYEKLRQRLIAFAGVASFVSLASRALSQAKSEAPGHWSVQIAADGSLRGLGDCEPEPDTDKDQAGGEGVILIARLLGLLLIFLGETPTLILVRNVWPNGTFDDCYVEDRRKA